MTKRNASRVPRSEAKPATDLGGQHATPSSRPRLRATETVIRQALDELAINKPYYSARVVGGRLELTLYGGDVAYWPEAVVARNERRSRATKQPPTTLQKGT